MVFRLFLLLTSVILLQACTNEPVEIPAETDEPRTPEISFEFVKSYPHDINAFTEGFLVHQGILYESTGATSQLSQTRSLFGIVDLKSGNIQVKAELDKNIYFGEGIAFLNNKVYQLTYQNKIGFIYDANTFKKLGQFDIPSPEGWGITTDGKFLIMSDGTSSLTWLDPVTLKKTRSIQVKELGYPVDKINELEFIKGFIYANIWMTNTIIKIDPSNGKVVGKMDMTAFAKEAISLHPGSQEMNGIAYDSAKNTVFITGKMWPKIYEITIK
ncbi:MAG: glutaminyl-peptide cyclotransferase [Bacteroidetes bacterium]|nr:glutaminyl-peptide cyclotransferase [Bacteroidota bacterium]